MDIPSLTLIDDVEILREIDDFYDEKKTQSFNTVEDSDKLLRQRYIEDALPVSTSECLTELRNFSKTENILIPSPLHIGWLRPVNTDDERKYHAFIDFISGKGLCIEIDNENNANAHQFLQNIGLKIILSLNPALINLTLIDPVGSGANFKILLGYEKAAPNLVLNKSDVTAKLAEILKIFNKLQTENLTFKYENLEDLNRNEPKLTKPYQFIFISNYPSGFRKEDQEMLQSIISKGHKYGAFVFMSYDPKIKPDWVDQEEIQSVINDICLLKKDTPGYKLLNCQEAEYYNDNFTLELESERPEMAAELILFLNNVAKENSDRPVTQDEYLEMILSGQLELWTEYNEATDKNTGIKAPVGLKSATKELEFTIGCGTQNYHSIVGGKTGSGKTILLDNIIVNSSIKYPPEELQFILLDFKGASFEKYRSLPHLKILFSSEGDDRSYGLNVLRFLVAENSRRQTILKSLGGKLNDLTKTERIVHTMPRLIIILDEFQVLLKERDQVTRDASGYIDTIAQQGRSAGMHLILSSQDLTGVTISETTQFNAGIRIALQMDPEACKQIFSRENTEASTLEKVGEAIYNEKPGRPIFANQHFRVYSLTDKNAGKIVEFLNKKYEKVNTVKIDRFILPNEKSASITNNISLLKHLSDTNLSLLYPKIYLGEPTFIKLNRKTYLKEDSYLQFKRAENSNLLMAGNDMNAASSILGLIFLQLLNHHQGAKIYLVNNFGADKVEWRERFKLIESEFAGRFKYYQKSESPDFFSEAEGEINKRKNDEAACSENIYLVILNLDAAYKKQEFTVPEQSKKLITVLKQGPDLGIHTLVYSYSAKSVSTSGIEPDLFESKLVLHGDSKDIITKIEKLEPTKEKMAYLYAPDPVTSINPDLFNVYSQYDELKLAGCSQATVKIIKAFVKDLIDNEQE